MKLDFKQMGLGGRLTLVAMLFLALSIIGFAAFGMLASLSTLLAVLALVMACVTLIVGRDVLAYGTLALTVAMMAAYAVSQVFYVANQLTAIDGSGFSGAFIFATAMVACSLVCAFAATIPSQRKAATAAE